MKIHKHVFLSLFALLCTAASALVFIAHAKNNAAGWVENWDVMTSPYFIQIAPGESLIFPNVSDAQAQDGKSLELRLAAGSHPGPGGGPEIETNKQIGYGTYATRLKTADCSGQPNAGVVTGYFVYFNDGSDANGNGLPDNVEIDFEWLCAEPQTIYLTMWTDYRDSDEAHKRVGRAINLQSGEILYSCYFESFGACQPLSGIENQPTTLAARPAYASDSAYYVYGFDWSADRVTWWMKDPTSGQRIVLWDYQGSTRIPPAPAYYMTNVWHTAGWTPPGNPAATEQPTAPVSIWVDWTRYEPPGNSLFLPLIRR